MTRALPVFAVLTVVAVAVNISFAAAFGLVISATAFAWIIKG